MNSFELNKIAGAVLGTLLAIMVIGVLGDALFHVDEPEQPGWAVAVPEAGEGGDAPAEEQVTPLPVRLASADAGAGETAARVCASCHSFEAGGPNKVGPNLHDVVGALITHREGFGYSQAFQQLAGEGFEWTYEHLDGFLEAPRSYIEGTAMAFAGVKDPQARANLIAYLRSQTENPPALPEPEAEPAAEEADAGPTVEGEAPAEQPTEPETQGQAAEEAAEADQAHDQGEPSGEPQRATPDLGIDAQQTPTGEGARVQPAPEDQESLAGARGDVPDAVDSEQQPTDEPAQQAEPAEQVEPEQPAAEPTEQPAEPAQEAPAPDQQGAAEPAEEQAQEQASAPASGLVAEIAAADVEEGQAQARKCTACHSLEEGANRVGPHLYGVVGREVASVEGYNYSEAVRSIGGEWSFEKLDAYLTDPRGFASGTKMAFPGIKDDGDRHALLHYLYTLQENPRPLQ